MSRAQRHILCWAFYSLALLSLCFSVFNPQRVASASKIIIWGLIALIGCVGLYIYANINLTKEGRAIMAVGGAIAIIFGFPDIISGYAVLFLLLSGLWAANLFSV